MIPPAAPRATPRLAVAAAICGLALLTFFQFPGHTWLQQDTQIYAPILEHLRDPNALDRDLVVQYPHVSYTLYDEFTIGLQSLTGDLGTRAGRRTDRLPRPGNLGSLSHRDRGRPRPLGRAARRLHLLSRRHDRRAIRAHL